METHIFNNKTVAFEPISEICIFCKKETSEKKTNLYHFLYKKNGFNVPSKYQGIISETNNITIELSRCFNCKDIHERASMIKSISTWLIIGLLFSILFIFLRQYFMTTNFFLLVVVLTFYTYLAAFAGGYLGAMIGTYWVKREIPDALITILLLPFVKEFLDFQWKHTDDKHKLQEFFNS